MKRASWLSACLLVAVFCGPLGIHDLGHSLDPHHSLEHLQAGGDDCVACALAHSPVFGPGAVLICVPPVTAVQAPVLPTLPRVHRVEVESRGERAPPSIS